MSYKQFLIAVSLCLTACGPSHSPTQIWGETMGTFYSVTIADEVDSQTVQKLQTEIDQALAKMNTVMSSYMDDSELSRINHSSSTDWQEVSPELMVVLQRARDISLISEGAFDITVAPVVNLWGFGPVEQKNLPP